MAAKFTQKIPKKSTSTRNRPPVHQNKSPGYGPSSGGCRVVAKDWLTAMLRLASRKSEHCSSASSLFYWRLSWIFLDFALRRNPNKSKKGALVPSAPPRGAAFDFSSFSYFIFWWCESSCKSEARVLLQRLRLCVS